MFVLQTWLSQINPSPGKFFSFYYYFNVDPLEHHAEADFSLSFGRESSARSKQ